jgi:hypothetical protein
LNLTQGAAGGGTSLLPGLEGVADFDGGGLGNAADWLRHHEITFRYLTVHFSAAWAISA